MSSLFDSLVPDITSDMISQLIYESDRIESSQLRDIKLLYDNVVEPYFPPSMSYESRQYRQLAWTPIAICSMIVDKIASALYSRSIKRTTGNDKHDELFKIGPWKQMPRLMLRVSKIASMQGYSVIRLRPVYPGGVAYATMGIGNTTPILDPDDPHGDPIGMIYDYLDEPIMSQLSRGSGGNSKLVHVREIITRHIRDKNGDIIYGGIHARFENDTQVDTEDNGFNRLGDYLDCLLWRGNDHPESGLGKSDVIPMISVLKAINETLTDANELVKWNLWPMLKTDSIEADISYTPRTIIKLGENVKGDPATLDRVDWGGLVIKRWESFYEGLLAVAHETSRVPAISTGDLSNIGQLSSGRAFEIAMTPLLELTREKEVNAVEQEIELIEATMAMFAYYDKIKGLTSRNNIAGCASPDPEKIRKSCTDAAIEFAPVKLPKDKMAEAQIRSVLRGAQIESTETALKALHPDWNDTQIKDELDRLGASKPEEVDASAAARIKLAQEKLKQEAE